MPQFYFHLYNSVGFVPDQEGQTLPGLEEARRAAIGNIRSILKSDVDEGVVDLVGRIELADAAGNVLAVVPFSEAIELRIEDSGT